MNATGYEIRLLASAQRELRSLDRGVAEQVAARLRWLAEHAEEIRHQALTGPLRGLFRLRTGNYRIIYELLPGERTIVVHAVGDRREIYRKR